MRRGSPTTAGFTLIELTIAIGLLGMIVGLMTQIINGTVAGRNMAHNELKRSKVENAILAQIVKDLRYVHFGGLVGDAGFHGKALQMAGKDADRVAFVTARRTRTVGIEDDGSSTGEEGLSPLTEVGYACRVNPRNSNWLELWRREDYFLDSKPTEGGAYTLVYDRIRAFKLRYFPIPEDHYENKEGLEDWDSRQKKGTPYAVLLKIEFDVDDPPEGEDPPEAEIIFRIILLRTAYSVPWSKQPTGAPPAMGG